MNVLKHDTCQKCNRNAPVYISESPIENNSIEVFAVCDYCDHTTTSIFVLDSVKPIEDPKEYITTKVLDVEGSRIVLYWTGLEAHDSWSTNPLSACRHSGGMWAQKDGIKDLEMVKGSPYLAPIITTEEDEDCYDDDYLADKLMDQLKENE